MPEPIPLPRTVLMRERLQGNPLFSLGEEHGPLRTEDHYAGRHVINSSTRINGGVYLGAGIREAIVVDDKKYPRELKRAYLRVRIALLKNTILGKENTPEEICRIVEEVASNQLGGKKDLQRVKDKSVELIASAYEQERKEVIHQEQMLR